MLRGRGRKNLVDNWFCFKKIYQCFRSSLSLCRHFDIISFLLLRDDFLSMVEMIVFSVKHIFIYMIDSTLIEII